MKENVESSRGFLFLLAAFTLVGTTACNGIDEGDAIGQASASAAGNLHVKAGGENRTENDPPPRAEIELHINKTALSEGEQRNPETAEGLQPATTQGEVSAEGVTVRVPPDPDNEGPDMKRRGGTDKLLSLETEEPEDINVNMPLTYLCVAGETVAAYYLYKPGHDGRLCELHYSGDDAVYYADWERNYCELKLAEHLQKRMTAGWTCYCGRPGGPDGVLQSTEEGLVCG